MLGYLSAVSSRQIGRRHLLGGFPGNTRQNLVTGEGDHVQGVRYTPETAASMHALLYLVNAPSMALPGA